jgi:hypothetical protein
MAGDREVDTEEPGDIVIVRETAWANVMLLHENTD